MDYEIVELEGKKVAGLSARTSNEAPDMGMVIGGLWGEFYQDTCYPAISGKKNDKALGIYTDYEGDEHGEYTVIVGCEVEQKNQMPEGVSIREIPAGKYAKFVVEGDMHAAVAQFWQKLWGMELDRAYTYDFEEYQNSDMEHAVIHMYIALK